MIQLKDLLPSEVEFDALTPELQSNLRRLHSLLVRLELASKMRFTITSGLRSMEKHERIYRDINAKRAKQGLPPVAVPKSSQHLKGNAADIWDPKRELQAWLSKNVKALEELGLWCESFEATPNWVHVQCIPPKSGNRFFKP